MLAITSRILAFLALVVVGIFAFPSIFGFFSVYDDEGYNVAMIRLVSQGVPLYTAQFAYHGPLPYLVKAAVLNALRVPVTHESVRLWVLALWLLSAWIGAAAIRNLTGNRILAAGGLIAVGVHLFPLRFNPGHPEDFVVILLLLALWVATSGWLSESIRVAILGLIAAALLATKVNVGVLYALGLGGWLLALLPKTRSWRAGALLWLAGSVATPAVLMHGAWRPEWQLLVMSTVVIFLISWIAFLPPLPARYEWKHLAICSASFVLGLAGIVVAAALSGSHPWDILNGAILTAAKHPSVFLRPVSFGILTIPVMAVFGLLSLRQTIRIASAAKRESRAPQTFLKLAVAGCAFILVGLTDSRFYFPLIGPVFWLITAPGGSVVISDRARNGRLFLAFAAAFQMLQAFPIIGTQTAWSTLLLCIGSLVLLHDAILEILEPRPEKRRAVSLSVTLTAGVAVYALLSFTAGLWNAYSRMPSLGLENSDLIRIPLATRANFDWLVASTDRYCDVLVTQPGMDSFLLWSKSSADMRTSPVLITGWPLILTRGQEQQTVAKVSQAARVCAIYNQPASEWWTHDDPQLTESGLAQQPLVAYIRKLQPIRKVGNYEVRANDAVAARWKEDYLLNGVRAISGGRAAVGVPSELLASSANAELVFEFQADRSGPLLSVQQPGQGSIEASATEPVVYVMPDGELTVRREGGSYGPLAPRARVLDVRWHELILRHANGNWAVSLDGGPADKIPDLPIGPNSARYLQLGPAFIADSAVTARGWAPFFGKLRDVRVRRDNAVTEAHIASYKAEN